MKSKLLKLHPNALVTITFSLGRLIGAVLIIVATVVALFVGVHFATTQAAQCTQWLHCPISQRYGQNNEVE